jgi:hypothetical protein
MGSDAVAVLSRGHTAVGGSGLRRTAPSVLVLLSVVLLAVVSAVYVSMSICCSCSLNCITPLPLSHWRHTGTMVRVGQLQ